MEIGISLGTNKGNLLSNLKKARKLISEIKGVRHLVSAPVYRTEPVDVPPEHSDKSFLNTVIVVSSSLEPEDLIQKTRAIECDMGRRTRSDQNLPRVIDIDLIYANHEIKNQPAISIPHPRWAERRFVVRPLADVRPDLILPGTDKTVIQQLQQLPGKPEVVLETANW